MPDVLVFVELHGHIRAAAERHAGVRSHPADRERLVTSVIPAICLRIAGSFEKSYSRRISCSASRPFSTIER